MVLDKILSRIQAQINDLMPTLELFVEESIQPSGNDCEQLQKQLTVLQEELAIYKYHKKENELSPSFNIHARVSENINEKKADKAKSDPIPEKQNAEPILKDEIPAITLSPMAIGVNDKFRFINELFKQNASEYNIAVEQLNSLSSWAEAEVYLNSLKMIYGWKDNSEVANHLFSLSKKRFL